MVTIAISAEQSPDGKTITFDTSASTYTDTDVISDYVRTLVLTDANHDVLATLPLGAGLTADYVVTKDMWIYGALTAVGTATYTHTEGFYFFRNTANKLILANSEGCCTSKADKESLCEALRFIKGAEYAAPIGNATAFQTNIDSANLYLDQVV